MSITSSSNEFPEELTLDIPRLRRAGLRAQERLEQGNELFLLEEERANQEAAKEAKRRVEQSQMTTHEKYKANKTARLERESKAAALLARTRLDAVAATPVAKPALRDVTNNLTPKGIKKDLQASLKTPTSTMPAQTYRADRAKHRFSAETLSLAASRTELFDGCESGKTPGDFVEMVVAENPMLAEAMNGARMQHDGALLSAPQRDALAVDTNYGMRQIQALIQGMREEQRQCNQLHDAKYDTIAQALQQNDDETQTRKQIIPKMSVPKFGQRNVAAKPASRSAQSASRSASAAKGTPDANKKTSKWQPPKRGWR